MTEADLLATWEDLREAMELTSVYKGLALGRGEDVATLFDTFMDALAKEEIEELQDAR